MEANNRAMREALLKIYREIRSYCFDYGEGESHKSLVDRIVDDPPDYTSYRDSILEIDRIVESALAEPPRNCDVGSAEEQAARMRLFCETNGTDKFGKPRCEDCRFLWTNRCALEWAQMPYKEGETNGSR